MFKECVHCSSEAYQSSHEPYTSPPFFMQTHVCKPEFGKQRSHNPDYIEPVVPIKKHLIHFQNILYNKCTNTAYSMTKLPIMHYEDLAEWISTKPSVCTRCFIYLWCLLSLFEMTKPKWQHEEACAKWVLSVFSGSKPVHSTIARVFCVDMMLTLLRQTNKNFWKIRLKTLGEVKVTWSFIKWLL